MYKVLLVDDEVFVRKGLRNLIDWEALGYSVAGEAENGEEALAAITETDPDLVITDIRMPVLDGLELIRCVKEEGKRNPTFIIVSGYHDFKYAQQALRYGVHDYVLKPIDEVELENTLQKLSSGLGLKKLARRSKEKPVHLKMLENLIEGSAGPEDAEEYAMALGWKISSRYVYLVADVYAEPAAAPENKNMVEKMAAVPAGLDTAVKFGPLQELQANRYGMLLHLGTGRTNAKEEEQLICSLRTALSRAAQAPVVLFAGRTVTHIAEVRQSYLSALEALQYRFSEDGCALIRWEAVKGKPLNHHDMDQALLSRLIEQAEENNKEGYLQAIDSIFQQFYAGRFAPSAIHNSLSRCAMGILKVIRDMDDSEAELPKLNGLLDWQNKPVDLKGLKELLIRFVSEAACRIAALRKEMSKGGIDKIRKYIEAHYMENISLKSIAARFFMNPVYLGQLFRKTYGIYFNDFLLGIRIQEAKKLLRQTDLRMYEVAERVGFQNADYFVTQFEKMEQASPTEYRNRLLGKI